LIGNLAHEEDKFVLLTSDWSASVLACNEREARTGKEQAGTLALQSNLCDFVDRI